MKTDHEIRAEGMRLLMKGLGEVNAERFIDKYTCRLCLKQRISAQFTWSSIITKGFYPLPIGPYLIFTDSRLCNG